MKRNLKRGKLNIPARCFGAFMSVAVAVTSFWVSPFSELIPGAGGISDVYAAKSNPITYEYYTVDLGNSVPASWIFVGTYLMSLKGVNAHLYQGALESREVYNQKIAFYSSELDKGYWKNIDNADSLSSILPSSETVEEKTLYPYLITVVVGDDGIPRDPLTGEAIDIYNLYSVYDMENIPELDGIEEYFNSGKISWSDKGSKNYFYRMLYFFFENDTLDGYREEVDIEKAVVQYNRLRSTPALLESMWDTALTTLPESYPADYRDVMLVMRNWPSVRDAITERADSETEQLNALYIELMNEKLEEEAESCMYVTAQIDATRRAEVYYNLIQNDKLFDSSGSFDSGELEDIKLIRAELVARQALEATELDEIQRDIDSLEEVIKGLEDQNNKFHSAIEAENTDFKSKKYDEEQKKLDDEYEKLTEEFQDVKGKYEALEARIQSLFDEMSGPGGESQKNDEAGNAAPQESISEQTEKKKTLSEETASKKAELENNLALLRAQKTAAEARAGELDDLKAKLDQQDENVKKLEKSLKEESEDLATMRKEADGYTSSRMTSIVDSSKKYDPDKKKELDAEVSEQQKKVNALNDSYFLVSKMKKDTEDTIKEINDGLALDGKIAELEASIDTDKKVLDLLEAAGIDSADAQILENLEKLASNDEAYEEKLNSLKDMKAQLDELAPDYFYRRGLIDQNRLNAEIVSGKIAEHNDLIADIEGRLSTNNTEITNKKSERDVLKTKLNSLDSSIEKINSDLKSIDELLKGKKGLDPNSRLQEALEIKIRALSDQKQECQTKISEQEKIISDADKEVIRLGTSKEDEKKKLEGETSKEYFRELEELSSEYEVKSKAINDQLKEIDDKITTYCANLKTSNSDIKEIEKEKAVYQKALATLQEYKTALGNVEKAKSEYDAVADKISTCRHNRDLVALRIKAAETEDERKKLVDEFNALEDKLEKEEKKDGETVRTGLLVDLEAKEANISAKEAKRDEALKELRKCPGYRDIYSIDTYAGILNSRIVEFDDRIELVRKKEPGYKDLAREKEIILKNINILEGMKKDKEKKLEKKYLTKLENLKDEIKGFDESIKENDANKEKAKKKLEGLKKDLGDVTKALEEVNAKKESVSGTLEQYNSSLSFGPMPTLYFLRDAVAAGNPTMGRKFKNIAAYKDMKFESDEELLSIIEQSVELCEQSYDSYVAKSLSRGESAADYTGYILSRGAAKNATDKEKALPYLQMITDLQSIGKNEIEHAERELSLLQGWLIPFSMDDFNDKRTTDAQGDYQYYIKAVSDRDTIENAITYVQGRLEYAYSLRVSFTDGGKGEVIESHIAWLENLLNGLKEKAGLDDGTDTEKSEAEEIEELMEQALEENNLVEYKRLKEYLEKVINAKDANTDEDSGRLTGESDLKPTDIEPTKRPTASQEILNVMSEDISKVDGSIDPKDKDKYYSAGGDEGTLLSELKEAGASDQQLGQAKKDDKTGESGNAGTADNNGSSGGSSSGSAGGGTQGTSGTDIGTGTDLSKISEADLDTYVREIMDGTNEEEKIALVAVLTQKAESSGDKKLASYAKNLLDELLRNGSTCIYKQYLDDKTKEYVSLGAMDRCRILSGFRYVRQDNDITMSQMFGGSASYVFTVGKKSVVKNDGNTHTMKANTVQQTDSYLRDDDVKIAYVEETEAKKLMECECVYIKNTDWALLITPGVAKQIQEIGDILNEMVARGEKVNIPKS